MIKSFSRVFTASVTMVSVLALAGVLAGSASATLADGDVQLGAAQFPGCVVGTNTNCESSPTGIANVTSGSDAFFAFATGNGYGIGGASDSGFGVLGNSNTGTGISASSSFGEGLLGQGGTNGVHGQTSSASDSGVWGENTGGGYGVSGSTSSARFGGGTPAGVWGNNFGSGPGVLATSSTGEGLIATAKDNGVHGKSSGSSKSGVWGENTSGGYGVSGSTSSSTGGPAGVWGNNAAGGPGVTGTSISGAGVSGISSSGYGVFAQGGVYGAWGLSNAVNGIGMFGEAISPTGIGVLAANPGGQGLKVTGGATFTGTTTFARSGTLTIPAGSTQATKNGISLGSTSLVMSTIQGNVAGVYVQGATTVTGTSGSFTVHLNKATPTALTVGWLIAN